MSQRSLLFGSLLLLGCAGCRGDSPPSRALHLRPQVHVALPSAAPAASAAESRVVCRGRRAAGGGVDEPGDSPSERAPGVWSHDGSRIATARGGRFWIFDVDAGRSHSIEHPTPIHAIAWSPDDARLVVEDEDRESGQFMVELVDAKAASLVVRKPAGKYRAIAMTPAFTSDGAFLVFVGQLDRPSSEAYNERPTVTLLRVADATIWRTIAVEPPVNDPGYSWDRMSPPEPLQVVLDRRLTFAAVRWSLETPLRAWDLARDEPIDVRSKEQVFAGVASSFDDAWLVWGEFAGVARYSRTAHRRASGLVPRFGATPLLAFAMHPTRSELLLLSGYTVGRWDLERGRRIWETTLREPRAPVATYVHPSRPRVAYLTGGERVLAQLNHPYLLDAATGHLVEPTETGDDEPGRVEQTGPGSAVDAEHRDLGAWDDGAIRAVHPDTHEIVTVDPTPRRGRSQLALTADRRRLVVADGSRGDVVWFDLVQGERHVLCEPIDPLPGAP